MKRLILLLSIIIIGFADAKAQEVKSDVIFDLSNLTDSTVYDTLVSDYYVIPFGGELSYQIVFEGFDCADAEYNAGEGNIKTADSYPSTVGGWDMPVILDTTALDSDGDLQFSKYRSDGIDDWNFTVIWSNFGSWYLFHNIDPGSCTTGTISRHVLIKRKK